MTLCNRQLIAFWEIRNSPATGFAESGESTASSVGVLGNLALVWQGVAIPEPAGSAARPVAFGIGDGLAPSDPLVS